MAFTLPIWIIVACTTYSTYMCVSQALPMQTGSVPALFTSVMESEKTNTVCLTTYNAKDIFTSYPLLFAFKNLVQSNASFNLYQKCLATPDFITTVNSMLEEGKTAITFGIESHNQLETLNSLYKTREKHVFTVTTQMGLVNYSNPSTPRGTYTIDTKEYLVTVGPSVYEYALAIMKFLFQVKWSYVAMIVSSEDHLSVVMSGIMHNLVRSHSKDLCIPLTLYVVQSNVTETIKQLRTFNQKYSPAALLGVLYLGDSYMLKTMWTLVTGSGTYSDPTKNYKWILGEKVYRDFDNYHESFKSYARGSVMIVPGIVDYTSTDLLSSIAKNMSSNEQILNQYPQKPTYPIYQNLINANSTCQYLIAGHVSNNCLRQFFGYDYSVLSILPFLQLLKEETISINFAFITKYLTKIIALNDFEVTFPFVKVLIDAGYTSYSVAKGLKQSTVYKQTLFKVYNVRNGLNTTLVSNFVGLNIEPANEEYKLEQVDSYNFYDDTPHHKAMCPAVVNSQCSECVTTSHQTFEFEAGDIYIGGLVPIHNPSPTGSASECQNPIFRGKSVGGYEFAMAIKFVVKLANQIIANEGRDSLGLADVDTNAVDTDLIKGLLELVKKVIALKVKFKIGYVILDTCYSGGYVTSQLTKLLTGSLNIPTANFHWSQIVGFVGSLSSTISKASHEVLKWYQIPLISFGSTATVLSDTKVYPYFLRTCPSDSYIVNSMVELLKYMNIDYTVVIFITSDYGQSLKVEMESLSARANICVKQFIEYNCASEDNSCKNAILKKLHEFKAYYVPFLSDLDSFADFLKQDNIEREIGKITFLTTESVGTSTAPFASPTYTENVGIGTLSMRFVARTEPAFLGYMNYYLKQPVTSANNISEWERKFLEDAHRCYVADKFNFKYTWPNVDCAVATSTYTGDQELESRSPLVIDAAATLVLGSLTAIYHTCRNSPEREALCPKFKSVIKADINDRVNLILYGSLTETQPQTYQGVNWTYQKIFANRQGLSDLTIWQFRKKSSTSFQFDKIGTFNNNSIHILNSESPGNLRKFERIVSALPFCYSKSKCASLSNDCANIEKKPTLTSDSTLAALSIFFGVSLLLLLLILLGVVLYKQRDKFRCCEFECGSEDEDREDEQENRPETYIYENRSFTNEPKIVPQPKPRRESLSTSPGSTNGVSSYEQVNHKQLEAVHEKQNSCISSKSDSSSKDYTLPDLTAENTLDDDNPNLNYSPSDKNYVMMGNMRADQQCYV